MAQYSDLEHYDPYAWSTQYPTPAPPITPSSTQKEAIPAEHATHNLYSSQKEAVHGDHQQPAAELATQDAGGIDTSEGENKPKIIAGMRRRNFIIVACTLALLVILGAILGGVLGTQLGGDSGDEYGHLISRHWTSDTGQWKTVNITEPSSSPYKPYPGSTIASATKQLSSSADTYYDAFVFFLDEDGTIRSYDNPHAEKRDGLFTVNDMMAWEQTVFSQSELVATFQDTTDSNNQPSVHLILAYQDPTGGIFVSNDSDWSNTVEAVPEGQIVTGGVATPLVLMPYQFGVPGSLQLNWQTPQGDSNIAWAAFQPDGEQANTWASAFNVVKSIKNLGSPRSVAKQHLAVSKMNSWQENILLLRENDGDIRMNYFNGTDGGETPQVTFTGGGYDDPQWGSIAAAHGGLFYGISSSGEGGQKILEYQVSDPDEGGYRFLSQVYP